MEPLKDLIKGLEILEPFLRQRGFEFNNYENTEDSRGQITKATYLNDNKKFIISYRLSIREVIYQFENSIVCHDFYLDQLGFLYKKTHPDFESENKLLGFVHILKDFELLVKDFFDGRCDKLKEFSKLQDNIITDYNQKAMENYKTQLDQNKIITARNEFAKKDFGKSIEIYSTVEYTNLLNDLDNKVIQYCKRHI